MPEVVWSLRKQLASRLRLKDPEDKTPRRISLKLSMTETDFVVLEDKTSLESNAVVLKASLTESLHYKPCLHESSNPGSTHFRSRTEFLSTNVCGLSQPGLQSGHTGGESGLELSCKRGYS